MELPTECPQYLPVEGPVDDATSLIRFEPPFCPNDPARSLKRRQQLGLGPETRAVDPNVRLVIDSFIAPRTWIEDGGVVWVQHASPFPCNRVEALQTGQKRHKLMSEMGVRATGVSAERSLIDAECALEVIRQVTAECWERGLLLLEVYSERVAAQRAHRQLFESRLGHAYRLALKCERDSNVSHERIATLEEKVQELITEEAQLKKKCSEFEIYAEEQLLIDGRRRTDELTALRKETVLRRAQLEAAVAVRSP